MKFHHGLPTHWLLFSATGGNSIYHFSDTGADHAPTTHTIFHEFSIVYLVPRDFPPQTSLPSPEPNNSLSDAVADHATTTTCTFSYIFATENLRKPRALTPIPDGKPKSRSLDLCIGQKPPLTPVPDGEPNNRSSLDGAAHAPMLSFIPSRFLQDILKPSTYLINCLRFPNVAQTEIQQIRSE